MENINEKTKRQGIFPGDFLSGKRKLLNMGKFTLILLLVATLGVVFVHSNTEAAGVKLRSSVVGDLITTDPATVRHTPDRAVAHLVYQGLVTFDVTSGPPFPIVPVLAKSYKISQDGKMITFKIHKGVKFHHGFGELTSEDVVFTMERHRDPKVASWARKQYADVERIEAVDRYTIRIYLKNSAAFSLLNNLAWQNAGFIVSKKAVTKLGDKIKTFPVGTGAFHFDRWDPGEKIVLKRFKNYWGTPPKIDEVEFWIIPEQIVALGALEKGDLDLAPVSQIGSLRRAKTIKGIRLEKARGSVWQYLLYINHSTKPMDDVRVRRALAHALDVEGICKRIGELVVPFPGPIPPPVFGATREFYTYDYNIQKAKKLLAEAGYPKGFQLRMIYKKGSLYEPIALEVQNSFRQILDVKLELIEKGVFTKTLKQYKHHIAVWALARYVPYLYAQAYEKGGRNFSNYSNPEVEAVIKKARTAVSQKEARKYWREFQKLVTRDVGNLWPAVGSSFMAIRNNVKGVKITPFTGVIELDKASVE
jgi:peptide/nickel transport system substrate-binding protein